MTLEKFLVIVCFVLGVVCYIGYRYASENVYLTYKDQRIPQNKKGEKK